MKKLPKFIMRAVLTVSFLIASVSAFAQEVATGSVKDVIGPVIGASVIVQGTTNGAITDADGNFSLPKVKKGDVLEISCIGYVTQTVVWNGTPLSVELSEDVELLEATVVTALGIRKDEKKVGYSISSVNSESLTAAAAPSLGSALYGKASGVRITTAPGGATGAISINVRGLSSITGSNQPLIIVDGVPVRNGEANNGDYWADQRVNSNGLADINVEDIENLTVLKGASATSLYGSEGANGVVLITMKAGKKNTGVHVDFNASLSGDFVAYMPTYQTTYGPAYPKDYWSYASLAEDGFYYGRTDRNNNKVKSIQNTYYYFGPKYDGSQVYTPTGMREYSPITSNPWNDVFRTAFTQQYNVAVQQGGEHGNFRFSYTFMDNIPNQYNSHLGKNNFQISGSQDITKNVKLGYSVSYMNQQVRNRAYRMARLVTNYTGMFGAFDDIKYYREHTVTSAGYQNRAWNSTTHENPAEGWEYNPAVSSLISEYFWNILGKEQLESNNRLIASVTPSWQIIDGLTLKGSIATDLTANKIENKNSTETSTALSGLSGYYGASNQNYQTVYGDFLVTYDKQLTDKLGLNVNAGYSARQESVFNTSVGTNGGLTVENWFALAASKEKANSSMYKSEFLKQALYATASFSYGNWGYLEGTVRKERASTMLDKSYIYPSINTSIIFSELFNMPEWIDYGKVRASYGIVGNAPGLYNAPMSYLQSSASGYTYNQIESSIGNDNINPETTYEWEFGLEGKFWKNRAGFELSYYTKDIKDMILNTTSPMSAGASSILMNIGELNNQGVEFSAYGTLIEQKDWTLHLSGNVAWNTNKVKKLADGVSVLQHDRADNGALYLYSFEGEKMGDIYAFAPLEDANGNKIVGADGYYKISDSPVKVGNAMPDLTGGFAVTVGWKRLTLDANFNFQVGGAVWNWPYQYMMGTGAIAETMEHRDLAHGGISYYKDDEGNCVAASSAPAGKTLYEDGWILEGVTESGEKNNVIVPADMIYEETYSWGTGAPIYYSHSVFDNTYFKCRELTLTYSLPEKWISKISCSNLRLSFFARNPFYIYKNLPIFDAEASDSTDWKSQYKIGGATSTTRTFGFSLRANF